MKTIILHLTDLHLNQRITYEEEKIKSLIKIVSEDDFSQNVMILFSGDISFSGKPEQYSAFETFINAIREGLVKEDKKIFFAFCPGNHDRNFDKCEAIDSSTLSSFNTDNYLNNLEKYHGLIEDYESFEVKQENRHSINKILSRYKFKIDEKNVVIYSLNNTYLSAYVKGGSENVDYNYENILLPRDLLKLKRGNEDYSFLLMHMPLRYLDSKTKSYLNKLCTDNIDLVFDGHVHEESITTSNDGYVEFTSSALYSNEMSGFTLIHLNDNTATSFVYVFDDEDFTKYRRDRHASSSILFREKMNTIDGFCVNKEKIDSETTIKIKDRIEINIDDIFVFPSLSEKRYKITKEKKHIESYDKFLDYIKDKKLINIIGDESVGKTTLARNLFYYFIRIGKSPVLCNGKYFESKNTSKTVKERILFQISDSYSNKNIAEEYFNAPISNRILILDNFEFVSTSLLGECSSLFDKIIFFSDEDADRDFDLNTFPGIPSAVLNIEPLFRSKREEMCSNIYSVLSDIKPEIKENISCDKFVIAIENLIDKMDASYMIDPSFLLDLSAKVLLNLEIYSSGKNLAYQKQHYNRDVYRTE